MGNLVLHKLPFPLPAKLSLEFVSGVPLTAPLDGPYRVRVTVFHTGLGFPTVVEMPVGSVPRLPVGPVLPLGLYRMTSGGPKITYVAVTAALNVGQFVVRIIAPDGRFAEATQIVT